PKLEDMVFHAKLGSQFARVQRLVTLAAELAPRVGADPADARRAAMLAKADLVPAEPVAVAVALADKLDLLAGFWSIDEKPTGSRDPFALRRAALGVIRLVADNEVTLPLIDVLKPALDRLQQRASADGGQTVGAAATDTVPSVLLDLLTFLHDRLKVMLRDSGARHDLLDAVITPLADDLLQIMRRAGALSEFLASEDGANLLAGYRRAANILSAEE